MFCCSLSRFWVWLQLCLAESWVTKELPVWSWELRDCNPQFVLPIRVLFPALDSASKHMQLPYAPC